MPNFGFLVHNDNGDIVIDDAYRNYQVLQTGTVTTPSNNNTVNITFPAMSAVPMIGTSGGRCFLLWLNTDANGNYNGAAFASDASTSIDYFVAGPATGVSSDQYGMRVKDAGGNVVFDSGLHYFRIMDVLQINVPTAVGSSATFSHASVAKPYYLLNPLHGMTWTDSTGPNNGNFFSVGHPKVRNLSSTSAEIAVTKTGSISGSNVGDTSITNPQYLVVCSL